MGLSKELFMNNRENLGTNIPAGFDDNGELYSTRKSSYNMKIDAWLQANKSELNELFCLKQEDISNPYTAYDEVHKARLKELSDKFPKHQMKWIF